MWYLERPSVFGASPVLSLTFVAITTSSLWSFRSSPTISSDLPAEYTLAVSKKFTPRSRARFTIGLALSISIIHSSELPKDIVPRQIRDTCSPVDPSRLCSIEHRRLFESLLRLRVPWTVALTVGNSWDLPISCLSLSYV